MRLAYFYIFMIVGYDNNSLLSKTENVKSKSQL